MKRKKSSSIISHRIDLDKEDQGLTFDGVLMAAGIFDEIKTDRLPIKWDLVSRMASQDQLIHVFQKYIRGFDHVEL